MSTSTTTAFLLSFLLFAALWTRGESLASIISVAQYNPDDVPQSPLTIGTIIFIQIQYNQSITFPAECLFSIGLNIEPAIVTFTSLSTLGDNGLLFWWMVEANTTVVGKGGFLFLDTFMTPITDCSGFDGATNWTFPAAKFDGQYQLATVGESVLRISTTAQPHKRYGVDSILLIDVQFNNPVAVYARGAALPTIDLNSGGTATLTRISPDGRTLTFWYQVALGETASKLDIAMSPGEPGQIDDNGASIIGNFSGQQVDLTLPLDPRMDQLKSANISIYTGPVFPPVGYSYQV